MEGGDGVPDLDALVAGLDGCRAGWVLATTSAAIDPGAAVEVTVIPDLGPLLSAIASDRVVAAAIDIPIGLPARDPRQCDVEARRMLGPRRNSVFPAPARAVLTAAGYEEACAISRRVCDKAISKQLFNILPKIREVDAALAATPGLQAHLFEMCPELSLTVLAGAPMTHAKTTAAGRAERMRALGAVFGDALIEHHVRRPPSGARADDVLDAVAGAWTARRRAAGGHLELGGGLDERGLRMEVVA